MKDRKYMQALENYQGDLLLVGINYDKKQKNYKYSIERHMKA